MAGSWSIPTLPPAASWVEVWMQDRCGRAGRTSEVKSSSHGPRTVFLHLGHGTDRPSWDVRAHGSMAGGHGRCCWYNPETCFPAAFAK